MDTLIKDIIKKNSSYIVKDENQIYQLSSILNQKGTNDKTTTIVDFGECEYKLKKDNNIDLNEDLILFKIENYFPNLKIPIIEYVVFTKDGKIQLDLSSCDEVPIQYYIPISIDDNEFYKYDSNSDFYNVECKQYTSESGTDMTLYDRKEEYNKNHYSLCEINCEFKGYNPETLNVECVCKIKNNINFFSDIYIDTNKLINHFINMKKISNIWVIKCYDLFFNLKVFLSNIGSYILLIIILLNTTILILFIKVGYNLLIDKIKKLIEKKFPSLSINEKMKNPPKRKGKNKRKSKRLITQNDILISSIYTIEKGNNNNNKEKKEKEGKEKEENEENDSKIKYIDLNDYELNSLSYKEAVKYDHRTYWEYYFSLIRTKQLIVFTFYTYSDYNSKLIKIFLFLIAFSLFYVVNALFFNDSTMHQIYEDQGVFNFIYHIPQILYSTIISVVIKTILSLLSLSEKNIIEIKNQENIEKANIVMKEKQKCLLIKFYLFFIISFLMLIIFWYYISCFCAVYKNTQIYLIEDTFISFATSLLYPFIINLLPGLLRIHSIKNKDKSCIFRISKIIQLI